MEELLGKNVKAVYQNENRTCVIKGILRRVESATITVEGHLDHNLVIIGKNFLVVLKEIVNDKEV